MSTAKLSDPVRLGLRLYCLGAGAFGLSACLQPQTAGQAGVGSTDTGGLSALWAPGETTDRGLVRAPEVFQASGVAQWNGQRTARGVWVAHPRARGSRRVRVVNGRTGSEIDAMLYRPERATGGDLVTVSSDAALALGLQAEDPVPLSIFGLRPKGAASRTERRAAENRALGELASHIARMDRNSLLQLTAAAMRGMGYATVFEPGPEADGLSSIHAFPRPDSGLRIPAIRVAVRPSDQTAMSPADIARVQTWLTGSGDLGVVVSVPGFGDGAERGLKADGAHLEMVDLEGLLNIWLTNYERLSEPDRALLPLQPIYFLAGG